MGKVITDRPLNKGAIRSMLKKAWGDLDDLHISNVGVNMFLFTFSNEKEVKDVLSRAPWYVMNKLVSLQPWTP